MKLKQAPVAFAPQVLDLTEVQVGRRSDVTGLDHKVEKDDRSATVHLAGELDLSVADELRDLLDRLIVAGRARIELDLSDAKFVDSRAIGVLIGAQKRAQVVGGRILVRRPQATVRKAFDILGLSPIFEID
ncbi:MAG TPA: STAS domain-containing protein [Acidimicrobiales bacterium]|nr:STAS domain-containing protein [Acidimicrobiales bacterium]